MVEISPREPTRSRIPMLTFLIWWAAIVLESLVLLRGFQKKFLASHPFFYTYIASVFVCDVLLYYIYVSHSSHYRIWALNTQYMNIILGYAIVLEIFRHVLAPYPGVERFARVAGFALFGLIFCLAIIYPYIAPGMQRKDTAAVEIEKDFLAVQGVFLIGILGVVFYYGIGIGRNLRGIIFGYILWLGTSLMTLVIKIYLGASLDAVWVLLEPFSYLMTLVIWTTALWSYHPNPIPEYPVLLEADYESLILKTKGTLGAMRSYLGKTAR